MKKLLKSKRGAAMASAVLFMFVIFYFGMLLTGVSMYTHLRVKLNNTQITEELSLEQIGENFVCLGEAEFSVESPYSAETSYESENDKTLTLKRNGKTVLYIVVQGGKVKNWRYSDPEPSTETSTETPTETPTEDQTQDQTQDQT